MQFVEKSARERESEKEREIWQKKKYRQIVIVCPLGAGTFYTLSSLFSLHKNKKKTRKKNRILVVEKVNLNLCCSCCCWDNSRARFCVVSQRYFDEFRGLLKGAEAKNTKKHTRAAAATATATIFKLAAIRKVCVVQSVSRRRCCWLRRIKHDDDESM